MTLIWMIGLQIDYCSRNDDYIVDQTENFERMTADLKQYLDNLDATCEAA